MSFPFTEICTLFQRLENVATSDAPLFPKPRRAAERKVIEGWFVSHRSRIDKLDSAGATALLSTLLPGCRPDRVYGIQIKRLHRILCRSLHITATSRPILDAYNEPGSGGLAACLERVLSLGGTVAEPSVTVGEVDDMLQVFAGLCPFSDPSLARIHSSSCEKRDQMLGDILKRLKPQDAKWLARIILKDTCPAQLDEHVVLTSFHYLLPDLLRFQNDMHAAVSLLHGDMRKYRHHSDPRTRPGLRKQATEHLRIQVGTKIGRPEFRKAFSIDHCLQMLGSQRWVVERKYDGEYCEIHVDLSLSSRVEDCIKIFSKSGKDSTADRSALLPLLVHSLRLGTTHCKFRRQAVFLGEMVVYSDKEKCVLPFEKIRKHVARSGRYIGTEEDSQAHPYEHLAIAVFDLLLLDDEVVMNKPVDERRRWLRESYEKVQGRVMGVEWKIIDFSSSAHSRRLLLQQFAASNAARCEGLLLKPCGVPYFSLEPSSANHPHSYIKLKKDYIAGMGDEADLAVIGASRCAQRSMHIGLNPAWWTIFHLGCLTNKDDVNRLGARPAFAHVGSIDHEHCIPNPILEAANNLAKFIESPYNRDRPPRNFDVVSAPLCAMDVVFDEPLVFEVLGSGFERPSGGSHLMLRHARVKKLHQDRTWLDCVSFQDLQAQGAASRADPTDSESQETRRWLERLEASCKKKFVRKKTDSPRSKAASTPTRSSINLSQLHGRHSSVTKRTFNLPRTPLPSSGVEKREWSPGQPIPISNGTSRRLRIALPTPLPSSAVGNVDWTPDQLLPASEENRAGKRPRNEEELPASRQRSKRPCTTELRQSPVHIDAAQAKSPLAEISANTAVDSRRKQSRSVATSSGSGLHSLTARLASLVRPPEQFATPSSSAAAKTACAGTNCLFANAVVWLVPCIERTPYIVDDLLSLHELVRVTSLTHWDRDSFAHPAKTGIEPESQSHTGMRKIVLVESRRQEATRNWVCQILGLNGGRFRERVEFYDWSVLECCDGHERAADRLKKCFLGATLFDDTRQRALFVSHCDWLKG